MKTFWSLLVIVVVGALAYYIYTQTGGRGGWVSKNYQLSGFDKVEVSTYADVNISQGDTESVSIDGYQKNLDGLTVKVEDGTLKIYDKNQVVIWLWFSQKKSTINLTVKDLSSFNLKGAGDLNAPKLIVTDLIYTIDGSGKATFADLTANKFEAKINGSGEINLTGKANQSQIEINGSGKINGQNFVVDNARTIITGSGNIKIDAIKTLVASINGSGEVLYVGEPFVTESILGSGKIEKIK